MGRPCLSLTSVLEQGSSRRFEGSHANPMERQTYGELALRIGKPGASRAVGTACGRNPVPVLVLVIGSGLRWQVRRLFCRVILEAYLLNLEASRSGMVPQSPW